LSASRAVAGGGSWSGRQLDGQASLLFERAGVRACRCSSRITIESLGTSTISCDCGKPANASTSARAGRVPNEGRAGDIGADSGARLPPAAPGARTCVAIAARCPPGDPASAVVQHAATSRARGGGDLGSRSLPAQALPQDARSTTPTQPTSSRNAVRMHRAALGTGRQGRAAGLPSMGAGHRGRARPARGLRHRGRAGRPARPDHARPRRAGGGRPRAAAPPCSPASPRSPARQGAARAGAGACRGAGAVPPARQRQLPSCGVVQRAPGLQRRVRQPAAVQHRAGGGCAAALLPAWARPLLGLLG
jgi:hypothetical protein